VKGALFGKLYNRRSAHPTEAGQQSGMATIQIERGARSTVNQAVWTKIKWEIRWNKASASRRHGIGRRRFNPLMGWLVWENLKLKIEKSTFKWYATLKIRRHSYSDLDQVIDTIELRIRKFSIVTEINMLIFQLRSEITGNPKIYQSNKHPHLLFQENPKFQMNILLFQLWATCFPPFWQE